MRLQLPSEVADIYKAVASLERRYPGRKFTPDGHMVGSIGEVIAADAFGLELLPPSTAYHDARDADGKLVQVKLTGGARIAMYGPCERLIVLRLGPDRTYADVVYDGPGQPIWNAAGVPQKNGQRSIAMRALRSMGGNTAPP